MIITTHKQFPNYKRYEIEYEGRPLVMETGKLAELCNSAVHVSFGETTVLVTCTASARPKDGVDYFPLSVDFNEKLYAVGRIPGSFMRREGKPSLPAVLASRLIDRPMRPLFPSDLRNDVIIACEVLSVDRDCSPEITAMIGASAAVSISDVPFNGPIAGIVLTFVMCYELIQLIVEKNNLHDFDTWIFFKWIFKTFCAVLIVTNTWNIVMAVFDVAQNVVSQSAGVIISDAGIDISAVTADLETQLADWSIGALLGLWFQSIFVGLCTQILSICIFLVIYGRMIEVYLVTSIGPIPFATMVNREWGNTGQNYLRSLLALGFQAFLIMICVGIYAVLVEGISLSGDNISGAIWGCMGYTVLLCFTLFKTGNLAKSLFGAH